MPCSRSKKPTSSRDKRRSPWNSIEPATLFTTPSSSNESLYSPSISSSPLFLPPLSLNKNEELGVSSLLAELGQVGSWEDRSVQQFISETEDGIQFELGRLKLPRIPYGTCFDLFALPDKLNMKRPNYLMMIILAIWGSRSKCLTLSQICSEISKRFPALEKDRPSYRNSIRHKLSLEPIFVNINKQSSRGQVMKHLREELDEDEEEGRGGLWVVDFRRRGHMKRTVHKRKKAASMSLQTPSLMMSSTGLVHQDTYGRLAAMAMYGYDPGHSALLGGQQILHHDMPAPPYGAELYQYHLDPSHDQTPFL